MVVVQIALFNLILSLLEPREQDPRTLTPDAGALASVTGAQTQCLRGRFKEEKVLIPLRWGPLFKPKVGLQVWPPQGLRQP